MEKVTVKELVEEVEKTYNDIGKASSQGFQFRKAGRKGDAQACMIRVKYLHRKLLGIKQQLSSTIKGNACTIKYLISENNISQEKEAFLTNVTNSDIEEIIKLYCRVAGIQFIKILDIKRISTKLG